jgi:hypothetical protein
MTERSGAIELTAGPHKLMVTYFDNGGGDGLSVAWSGPGIQKQPIPADRLTAGGTGETLHDLAIQAVAAIPGYDKEKFADLTKLIKSDRQRTTAIQVLRTLPDTSWDAKELPSLVDNLVGYLSSIPAKLRTRPSSWLSRYRASCRRIWPMRLPIVCRIWMFARSQSARSSNA